MKSRRPIFPQDVEGYRRILVVDQDGPDHLVGIAQKLMKETADLICMWEELEKVCQPFPGLRDGFWVYLFLTRSLHASELPLSNYASNTDRKGMLEKITKNSKRLSDSLKEAGLNVYIHPKAKKAGIGNIDQTVEYYELWEGIITEKPPELVTVLEILGNLSEWATGNLNEQIPPGKVGKTVKEVKFINSLAMSNKTYFGDPLKRIVATACNAIFNASYIDNDITKIISRRMK